MSYQIKVNYISNTSWQLKIFKDAMIMMLREAAKNCFLVIRPLTPPLNFFCGYLRYRWKKSKKNKIQAYVFGALGRRFVRLPAVLILVLQPLPLKVPRHEAADQVRDPRYLAHFSEIQEQILQILLQTKICGFNSKTNFFNKIRTRKCGAESQFISHMVNNKNTVFRLGSAFTCFSLKLVVHTVCPRSSNPFFIVSYYIKWVTTS